jgi:hypothetical protein
MADGIEHSFQRQTQLILDSAHVWAIPRPIPLSTSGGAKFIYLMAGGPIWPPVNYAGLRPVAENVLHSDSCQREPVDSNWVRMPRARESVGFCPTEHHKMGGTGSVYRAICREPASTGSQPASCINVISTIPPRVAEHDFMSNRYDRRCSSAAHQFLQFFGVPSALHRYL